MFRNPAYNEAYRDVLAVLGGPGDYRMGQIREAYAQQGYELPSNLFSKLPKPGAWGVYTMVDLDAEPAPTVGEKLNKGEVMSAVQNISKSGGNPVDDEVSITIPEKDKLYVPFGEFEYVSKVIESGQFFPLYITGLSGNGKTFMVEQACARLKRPMIRVNLTNETDEEDLIGGFRLVNGETVYFKGPVITAMEEGAVLLLDEVDLANPARVMCLQSILEGKGYFIKKLGEYVKPKAGFTVLATANTKGRGDDTAKFIATNVMNEAFLERFPVTIEQAYPDMKTEKTIMERLWKSLGLTEEKDTIFMEALVKTAEDIRKTYFTGGIDEILSTRRMVHIGKNYSIIKDAEKALALCCNRFDEHTKKAFIDTYKKHLPVGTDEQAARKRKYTPGSVDLSKLKPF